MTGYGKSEAQLENGKLTVEIRSVNGKNADISIKTSLLPKEKDIIFAEKVIREIDTKKAMGIGVFTVDGKMIDIAFYDGAKRTIALAKASGIYKGDL